MKQAAAENKRIAVGKNTEGDVLAAIGAMDDFDRPTAEGLHALVQRSISASLILGAEPIPDTPGRARDERPTDRR